MRNHKDLEILEKRWCELCGTTCAAQYYRRCFILNPLYKVYPSIAVFAVVPGFQPVPSVALSTNSTEPRISKPLSSLYDRKYCTIPQSDLKAAVEDIQIRITASEASSCILYDHRIGRIMASMIGEVAKCTERKFSTSLVNSIMQNSSPSPSLPSLKWGHQNEERAKTSYRKEMDKHHSNFSICSVDEHQISLSRSQTRWLNILFLIAAQIYLKWSVPITIGMLTHLILKTPASICILNQMAQNYWILVMIITIKYKGKWQYGRRTMYNLQFCTLDQ